jgi:AcrR family transcriptional regulator
LRTKKKQLIEAALRCFAKKGFHATSIQDIIEEAGSAKGSLYAYFDSKEDLLLTSLEHVYELVMERFTAVAEETDIAPRDRVACLIRLHFEVHLEHSDFYMTLMDERAFQMNEALKAFMFKAANMAFQIYHDPVSELFGPPSAPYLYDALFCLKSLIHQLTRLLVVDRKPLDLNHLSDFVMDRLEDIATGMMQNGKPPVFDKQLSKLKSLTEPGGLVSCMDELASVRSVLQKAAAADMNLQSEEILSYLTVLESELKRSPASPLLLDTVMGRLLSYDVAELNNLLGKIAKIIHFKA